MKNLIPLLGLFATLALHAQSTNLVILHAVVGDERAPVLTWQSESNAVYRIDYADTVVNTNTQWKTLYEDYPSHGTNTFWMDSGNDSFEPEISHPKRKTTRFYRLTKTGTNTAAAPFVQIISVTNNTVLSDEVVMTVVATTSLAYATIRLYVDGQELYPSDDGTNFILNTPEWANGSHVLFATAKAASKMEGNSADSSAVTYGRSVSAYVPVTFDNYVSQLYFSEPFFEPSLGQTQHVSAVFASYSTWTLQILNQASNVVRTVTNSGYTMEFDWDGTGDGGTNLPNGIYEYLVTAAQATAPSGGGGGGGTNDPPPGPGGSSMQGAQTEEAAWYPTSPWQAFAAGWDSYFILPPPMPPVKIDDKWYTWESVFGPVAPIQIPLSPSFSKAMSSQLFAESSTTSSAAAAAGAGAAKGPKKPPTKPVKGSVGTFGLAYQEYAPGGTSVAVPSSGLPSPLHRISLEGSTGNRGLPILNTKLLADNFVKGIKAGGWKPGFIRANNAVRAVDIRKTSLGGSNIFSSVNLGVLLTHGFYGSSVDYTTPAQQTYQTYMPFLNNGANDWLRASECSFGSTNLRWMAVFACNFLRDQNYQSMYNQQVLPINPNLHLLCTGRSTIHGVPELLQLWAEYMTKGKGFFGSPMTVRQAFFVASEDGYGNPKYSFPGGTVVAMRVAGWPNCMDDKLFSYFAPGTTDPSQITFDDHQVYPKP